MDEANLWPRDIPKAEYLFQTFGIGEERAKQLRDFLEIREAIQGDRLPDNERQTRALMTTEAANWQSVWDRACKASGKKAPTSTTIERIINMAPAKAGRQGPEAPEGDEDVDFQPPEPEEYVLDLKLTVKGTRDPVPLEKVFAEWNATSIDVVGEADLGVGFKCSASNVRNLTDTLAHLLDRDVETLTIHIKKTERRLDVDRKLPN